MRECELKPATHTIFSGHPTSLPMRERELKLSGDGGDDKAVRSLPMRERELKPALPGDAARGGRSLPMRERELKHGGRHLQRRVGGRSPCGSAN